MRFKLLLSLLLGYSFITLKAQIIFNTRSYGSELLGRDVQVSNSGSVYFAVQQTDPGISTNTIRPWFNSYVTKINLAGDSISSVRFDSLAIKRLFKISENSFVAIGEKLVSPLPSSQYDLKYYLLDSNLIIQNEYTLTQPLHAFGIDDAVVAGNNIVACGRLYDNSSHYEQVQVFNIPAFTIASSVYTPILPVPPATDIVPNLFYDKGKIYHFYFEYSGNYRIYDTLDYSSPVVSTLDMDAFLSPAPPGIINYGMPYSTIKLNDTTLVMAMGAYWEDGGMTGGYHLLTSYGIADTAFNVKDFYVQPWVEENYCQAITGVASASPTAFFMGYTKNCDITTVNMYDLGELSIIAKSGLDGNVSWRKTLGDSAHSYRVLRIATYINGGVLAYGLYNRPGDTTFGYFITALDSTGSTVFVHEQKPAMTTDIQVYPNPCGNFLIVQAEGENQIPDLAVINFTGQEIIAVKNAGKRQELDLSHLPCGTYLLKCMTPKGAVIKKIIKT